MAAALMRKAEWEEMEIPQSWLPIPLIKVGVPVLGAEEQPSAEHCPRNGIACGRSSCHLSSVHKSVLHVTEATAHVTQQTPPAAAAPLHRVHSVCLSSVHCNTQPGL